MGRLYFTGNIEKEEKILNKFVKNVALYVLLIIIAVSIFNTFVHPQEKHSEITYSDFISQVEKKNVDTP